MCAATIDIYYSPPPNKNPTTTLQATHRLLSLLSHKFPKVRRHTADQLYVALITFEDALPEPDDDDANNNNDDGDPGGDAAAVVLDLLSETAWDGSPAEVRAVQAKLYAAWGMEAPKRKARPSAKGPTGGGTSTGTYVDLVRAAGY